MSSKNYVSLFGMMGVVVLVVSNFGCGGGTSSTSPPVTVTVVGPSATLNTGSSFTLTATVHN